MSRAWLKAAALAASMLVLPLSAIAAEKIAIPSETPTTLAEFLRHTAAPAAVVGYLYLPQHVSGPVPALILKHGSGGLGGPTGDNIRLWAKSLNDWGVAAFVVDSFGPRGIESTGTNQGQLRTLADIADSLFGLKVLAADPRIDASRIGIMGWSRGGEPAMVTALQTATRAVLGADGPKFAAHVVFYGPAAVQYRDSATDGAPFLFLHGESDDYVPIGPTREWSEWLKTMGNPVTFYAYPKTFHDFDVEGTRNGFASAVETSRNCDAVIDLSTGHVVRMDHKPASGVTPQSFGAYMRTCGQTGADLYYNGQARADSVEKVHAFLRQVFHLPS
jgi:dienelactone hydrolase